MRSAVFLGLALAGCSTILPPSSPSVQVMTQLRAADGADRGQAVLRVTDGRMRLTVNATGLNSGARGIHLHEVGRCDALGFTSAGEHWNPSMKKHGRDNPAGTHYGDLPNLMIGSDGRGTVTFDVPGSIAALLDADGAAVLIHADADDYRTDPSGNSGDRIACGVLTAP